MIKSWRPPADKVQELWASYTHLALSPIRQGEDLHKILLVIGKLIACGATKKKQAPLPAQASMDILVPLWRQDLVDNYLRRFTTLLEDLERTSSWVSSMKSKSGRWVKSVRDGITFLHNFSFIKLAAGSMIRSVYRSQHMAETRLALVWPAVKELSTVPSTAADMIHPEYLPRFWWIRGIHKTSEDLVGLEARDPSDVIGIMNWAKAKLEPSVLAEVDDKLQVLLSVLPPMEGYILRKLTATPPLTGGEIAQKLGVSRQRVNQLAKRAKQYLLVMDWTKWIGGLAPVPTTLKYVARHGKRWRKDWLEETG